MKPCASAGPSRRGTSGHARPTRFPWQKPPSATEGPKGKKDLSDEVGQKAERALARALATAVSAAIRGDAAGIVLDPAKTIVKGMIL